MEEIKSLESRKQFTNEEIAAIKATIAHNLTKEELALFFATCKRTGLDAISRQIYCTVTEYTDKRGQHVRKLNIQATVDGFRLIAERSGDYAGQVGPFWCGHDGQWVDVWLKKEPPAASKVGILRSKFKEPLWAVAKYESYAQSSPVWHKMPEQMLAKCAESLALRKAFPNDLSGLYTNEEMAQSEKETRPIEPLRHETKALPEEISFEEATGGQELTLAEQMFRTLEGWKVPFGKKYLGKTLLEMGLKNSKDYCAWLKDQVAKDGKEPSLGAKKYFEMVELYEAYIQEVEHQQQTKVHSPQSMTPPVPDYLEEIPF